MFQPPYKFQEAPEETGRNNEYICNYLVQHFHQFALDNVIASSSCFIAFFASSCGSLMWNLPFPAWRKMNKVRENSGIWISNCLNIKK
jgi:hypothetical protein